MSYSHMGTPTLPSAQLRFTSEFGMGSGGTTMLLSLDKNMLLSDVSLNINNLGKLIVCCCLSITLSHKYLSSYSVLVST